MFENFKKNNLTIIPYCRPNICSGRRPNFKLLHFNLNKI